MESNESLDVFRSKWARRYWILKSIPHFARVKNRYRGRRGFVIGNGPSLKISDLDRLTGEITIAANKVYLAFDQTAWRPSFISCVDQLVWDKIKEELFLYCPSVYLASYLKMGRPVGKVYMFRHLGGVGAPCVKENSIQFSSNLVRGAFGGATVTYSNLQLAAHLGLNPIYLIGCDHYYAGERGARELEPVEVGGIQNHFIENYRRPGELVNPAPIERMSRAYDEAMRYSISSRVKILNATRGGHLEAFPRVAFDSIV